MLTRSSRNLSCLLSKEPEKLARLCSSSFCPTDIFQQDGAPVHTSKVALKWLENNLNSFWGKGVWPGNSPDLSPIENL